MLRKLYHTEEWFTSFQKGEEWGFARFFDAYFEPLTHFAFSYLGNKEASEDIVEESFLKLWEKRSEIDKSSSIKTYLYTSVRNGCIDLLRKEKTSKKYKDCVKGESEEHTPDITHRIIAAESFSLLFDTMDKLPIQCRQVLELYYFEDLSLTEIAEKMGVSLTTVKTRKGEALQKLRKQLPRAGFILLILFII